MSKAHKIRNFVEHPITNLAVGIFLFVSGFVEAYDTFYEDIKAVNVGAHHGLMVFGMMNVLASIPDIFEGLSKGTRFLEK